jgi:hypothetical protein
MFYSDVGSVTLKFRISPLYRIQRKKISDRTKTLLSILFYSWKSPRITTISKLRTFKKYSYSKYLKFLTKPFSILTSNLHEMHKISAIWGSVRQPSISTPVLFNGFTLNFVMGSAINIACRVYCNADGQNVARQLTVKHLAIEYAQGNNRNTAFSILSAPRPLLYNVAVNFHLQQ